MLLPQSSHHDPTTGTADQDMTDNDNDNNPTPQPTSNTQSTQDMNTRRAQPSSQPNQDNEHNKPADHKTWMGNDPM
eukprot:13617345-Heterocapsa_arctica.AAC.1